MEIAGLVYFIFAVVCAFELSYDAKQRNMSSLWWGIVGFFFGIFGCILYLAVKKPYRREQKISKMRDLEFLRELKEKRCISEAEYEKYKAEVLE
ncbi:TPA: PLDc N-terminal domain-containing protein [Campylobacter coli]|nr:PLDc N-terminal domain-containing protein [Campylobacter coli]HED0735410.1 PLDc N-terminal domain-containing protein [Campylobacter coli]